MVKMFCKQYCGVWYLALTLILGCAESDKKENSPTNEAGESDAGKEAVEAGFYDLSGFDLTKTCQVTLKSDKEVKRSCCEETSAFSAGTIFGVAGLETETVDEEDVITKFYVNPIQGNLGKTGYELSREDFDFQSNCSEESLLAASKEYLVLIDFKVASREAEEGATAEEKLLCTVPAGTFVTGINAKNKQCNLPVVKAVSDAAPVLQCVITSAIESLITLGTAGTVTFEEVPSSCEGQIDTGTRYNHNNLYTIPFLLGTE